MLLRARPGATYVPWAMHPEVLQGFRVSVRVSAVLQKKEEDALNVFRILARQPQ
jgi:hypothetical protein